ncbi:TLD domain-containing protein 2 isoform X4 [Choloepus didactylus]|uniref:TLD domain-containing protein 2 isoform X4 n=1 Tax=Choloepus didactylus TaxID=27675 RepID=UPI00189E7AFE|nr:TLD domain-containing protein 2 isoform X4 [Choloepus didactylus]
MDKCPFYIKLHKLPHTWLQTSSRWLTVKWACPAKWRKPCPGRRVRKRRMWQRQPWPRLLLLKIPGSPSWQRPARSWVLQRLGSPSRPLRLLRKEGGRRRIPCSSPALSPAQPPPPPKSHWTFLESGLLHVEGWLQSAETVPADGGPQRASAPGAEGPGWADVWGLLLLGSPTQQRLLRHWRDVSLLLLATAEGLQVDRKQLLLCERRLGFTDDGKWQEAALANYNSQLLVCLLPVRFGQQEALGEDCEAEGEQRSPSTPPYHLWSGSRGQDFCGSSSCRWS